jgi:hypothetical protein
LVPTGWISKCSQQNQKRDNLLAWRIVSIAVLGSIGSFANLSPEIETWFVAIVLGLSFRFLSKSTGVIFANQTFDTRIRIEDKMVRSYKSFRGVLGIYCVKGDGHGGIISEDFHFIVKNLKGYIPGEAQGEREIRSKFRRGCERLPLNEKMCRRSLGNSKRSFDVSSRDPDSLYEQRD